MDTLTTVDEYRDWIENLVEGDTVVIRQENWARVAVYTTEKIAEVKKTIYKTDSGLRFVRYGWSAGEPYQGKGYYRVLQPTPEHLDTAHYHATGEGQRRINLMSVLKTTNWNNYETETLDKVFLVLARSVSGES